MVYTRGYGMSNFEYDVAIAPASIFHVASISKQDYGGARTVGHGGADAGYRADVVRFPGHTNWRSPRWAI